MSTSVLFAPLWTFSKVLGTILQPSHSVLTCQELWLQIPELSNHLQGMSFVLPLLMQDNWEETEGVSHTSEDCASSSSQCNEFTPSGILLLNLYSNGKVNPFLKGEGKKKKDISVSFGFLMSCLSRDLATILTRWALAACVGCSPAVYFFQLAVSKTSMGFGWRLPLPHRTSTAQTQPKPYLYYWGALHNG